MTRFICCGIFKAILPDQLCHAKNTKLFLFMTWVKKKKKNKNLKPKHIKGRVEQGKSRTWNCIFPIPLTGPIILC